MWCEGISYGLFGKPDEFVPQARDLGAGLLRAYVYWAQVEPEPDRWTWDSVDALLDQLDADGLDCDQEVWLTVCSSSPWAIRQPTDFLPPSPAKDIRRYAEFVERPVERCRGKVNQWQCENEASNTGLLWAGTAGEYLTQLAAFHDAVSRIEPAASVVLAGCGYDVFSSPPDSAPRQFFDQVAGGGRDLFDLFSVNLYGDPRRVPDDIETARDLMRAHGYTKPIVAGEHGGPVLFEFPDAESALQETFAAAFREQPATQSTSELIARAAQETPERRAMKALYARMAELPPRLQMLMAGCPPKLEAKRNRINCRQLVMRTVLAAASGVETTAYWHLAPEVPNANDPYQTMHLLFGKLFLLDYTGDVLGRRQPAADTFELLARRVSDVSAVSRIQLPQAPTVAAFRLAKDDGSMSMVLWDDRDTFDGEDQAPIFVAFDWSGDASVTDAFGRAHPARISGDQLTLELSDTPMFVG